MKPYRQQRILIRLQNLSAEAESDLKRDFQQMEIGSKRRRVNGKDKFVVLLRIDESFDCDKMSRFLAEHKILKRNYMIRVSLVTGQYSDGVLVPKHVLRALCCLGCNLNFSFTKV